MPDLAGARWRKSSRSGNQGNCVEMATTCPRWWPYATARTRTARP